MKLIEDKIIDHLTGKRPPAFVLRSDRAHGLAVVRSLGRRGIRVVALNQTRGPGRHSRYALNIDLPSEIDQKSLLDLLCRSAKASPQKPFLIATSDQDVLFIVRNRAELSRYFSFVVADTETAERIANKRTQYEFAEANNVPLSRMFPVKTVEDVERVSSAIAYPCVVKPVYSDLWRDYREGLGQIHWQKLAVVSSPVELVDAYTQMSRSGLEFLLQEFVPGGDDQIFSVFLYLDRNSKLLAAFARQKLRQWPVEQGSGCFVVSVVAPEVIQQSTALLQSLNYSGLANVEFKKDARDGEFKLIEINIRSGNLVSIAIDLGMDFPYIAYCDAVGQAITVDQHYRAGHYWLDFGTDVRSFLYSWGRGGIGPGTWIASALRARSFAYFASDDLKPWFARVWELVRDSRDLFR